MERPGKSRCLQKGPGCAIVTWGPYKTCGRPRPGLRDSISGVNWDSRLRLPGRLLHAPRLETVLRSPLTLVWAPSPLGYLYL